MEFRDFAARETASLVARLLTGCSEQSLHDLRALRETIDRAEAAAQALAGPDAAAHRDALDALVQQLTAAADAEVARTRERLEADAAAALETVRKDLEKQTREHAALTQRIAAIEGDLSAAQTALEAAQARTDAVSVELAKASEAAARAEAAHRDAEAAREHAEREAEALKSIVAKAQAEAAALTRQLEIEAAERAKAVAALQASDERGPRDNRLPLDRLRAAFQQFAGCKTPGDVMTAVVHALSGEFSRVALFTVNGTRLEGREQAGFDGDISKLVVPVNIDSALAHAVKSGRVQGITGRKLADAAFGGTPAFAVAIPIVVRGQVTGVIYADDSGQAEGQAAGTAQRIKFAELLFWHAVPMLQWLSGGTAPAGATIDAYERTALP